MKNGPLSHVHKGLGLAVHENLDQKFFIYFCLCEGDPDLKA